MSGIQIQDPKKFVDDFLDEYLANGFGAKTKRELDILVMSLLMNYGDLAGKSNQDLSILLQAPEGKIKSLRYEARLKYPPEPDYVKKEFLYVLSKAHFDIDNDKVIFVLEDDYLRHAIQGELKHKGMFADTSFNTELVKIDKDSLKAVIGELYGQQFADEFQIGIAEMEDQVKDKNVDAAATFSKTIIGFVLDTAQKLAIELIRNRIGF
ncbi:MAG TPA: hypothetical protein VGK00_17410 [Anaerolineales bacterium]|jgi:hypothetical protein